jgi:hypothetical protein
MMMTITKPIRTLFVALLAVMMIAAACGDDSGETTEPDADTADEPVADEPAAADQGEPDDGAADLPPADEPESEEPATGPMLEGELVGLFGIDPADCSVAGSESGTYFRMVEIGGTVEDGPFVSNFDSTCADQTFTPLAPGSDGGLLTGELQPGGEPLFDESSNATADRIAEPALFFSLAFGMATTDEAAPPMIIATSGELTGNVASVSAYYAGEIFNQGSPKPDDSTPGNTTPGPTGTIDDDTGAYVLDWASQIVGGAFNDFTGVWHLEGTFTQA